MGNIPGGWTPVDIQAEHAPLGVQLWPTVDAKYAPNYTLEEVRTIRHGDRTWVEWVYESGNVRQFPVGELVASMVREQDAEALHPFRQAVLMNEDELAAVAAMLNVGLGRNNTDPSPATMELAHDVLKRILPLV